MSHAGDERRYVRTVEAAWSKILGRPAFVSPREFEAIDAWRRRGIPLAVVLEVIAAAGKRRSGSGPKALTSLSHAVLEAWSVVAAGRTSQDPSDTLPERGDARRAWEEAQKRCAKGAPLSGLLARLLAEEGAGSAPADLDAALDESLPGAVPEDLLARAGEETGRSLEPFRGRMSEDEFRRTFERALVDRLRALLALPRLALTRLAPTRQGTPHRLE